MAFHAQHRGGLSRRARRLGPVALHAPCSDPGATPTAWFSFSNSSSFSQTQFYPKFVPRKIGPGALQALGHTVQLIAPQYVKPFAKRNKNDAAVILNVSQSCGQHGDVLRGFSDAGSQGDCPRKRHAVHLSACFDCSSHRPLSSVELTSADNLARRVPIKKHAVLNWIGVASRCLTPRFISRSARDLD